MSRLDICVVLLGLVYAVMWTFSLLGVNGLPGWFFFTHQDRSLGPAFFALVAGFGPWIVRSALSSAAVGKTVRALGLLILVGASAQFTLHYLLPDGLEQSFGRLYGGHGKFLRVASARRGQLLATLRDYEALIAADQLGPYAASKGPGTLGFYMLVDQASQWQPVRSLLAPLVEATRASRYVQPVAEPAAFVLVLFPLLSFLTLLPLGWLAATLLDDARAGVHAGLLYLSAPGIMLIDLHLDGALYPLLGIGCIALAVAGVRGQRPLLGFLGGALGSLGVYCTFGLVPCVALALVFAAITAAQAGLSLRPGDEPGAPWRRLTVRDARPLLAVGSFVLGLGLSLLSLHTLLNYAPLTRFVRAMAFHEAWKADVPKALWRLLSLLEFGLYAGMPLMLALVALAGGAVLRVSRRPLELRAWWALAVLLLLLTLALLQGTNEVGRIWLFMIPLIALAVAGRLGESRDTAERSVCILAAVQAGLTVLMKVRQLW